MPKVNTEWTVLPHGKLTEVDQNILTVTGIIRMPLADLPRRMTVVRIAGKRLIIFSAIALEDSSMRVLEAFGEPAFLIVPSDKHRIDARIWKDRYPAMQVVAPSGSRDKIENVVHVSTTKPRFDDSNVEFITVAGTAKHEAALLIQSPNGFTLVLNDLVGNIRRTSGFSGWFLGMMDFAGDKPQIPRPVKLTLIKDRPMLRAQFLQWAALPRLKRILVSHGEPIDVDPAKALREFAQSLAPDRPEPRVREHISASLGRARSGDGIL